MGTLLGLLDQTPQPTLANVQKLVARMAEAGLEVRFVIEGERRPLPAALEVSAFRVVQEGLTNVVEHASRAHASVVVRYDPDRLQIDVEDDGHGSVRGAGGRRGLAGLSERLTVFGGLLEAGSLPRGGWKLQATFPLASR